jgi:hypothetical protein
MEHMGSQETLSLQRVLYSADGESPLALLGYRLDAASHLRSRAVKVVISVNVVGIASLDYAVPQDRKRRTRIEDP